MGNSYYAENWLLFPFEIPPNENGSNYSFPPDKGELLFAGDLILFD